MTPDETPVTDGWPERLIQWLAWIVPASGRSDWRREWQAEFAAYARRRPVPPSPARRTRVVAAARHALWLRWHGRRLEMLMHDVRHAVRALARRPGYTLAAALTIAVGIGANTAVYSALRAVLWRPLPFPAASGLVMVSSTTAEAPDAVQPGSVSPPDFVDWRAESRAFRALAAFSEGTVALTGAGVAEQVPGSLVTGDFFTTFGVPVAHGRALSPTDDEPGGPDVVVLGHRLWQRRFGSDPRIVGQVAVLDGVSREVVGVMPPGFDFPRGTELWMPQRFTATELLTQRGAHYLTAIGRLQSELSLEEARAGLSAITARLASAYPRTNANGRVSVHELRNALVGDVRPALRLLFGAVSLVLLVACVNVANLVLGAALDRSRDIAVRSALGASRGRVVRALLVESLVVAGLGGLAGLVVAMWGARMIAAATMTQVPFLDETRIDLPVLLFAAAATVGSALMFGLLPAWRSSRADVLTGLRAETGRTTADRGGARARRTLVTAEIALAVSLLVGAGLVGRSFLALVGADLGFDGTRVQTYSLSLPEASYSAERRATFVDDLLAVVKARPDVETAGAIFGLPLSGINYYISGYELDGRRLELPDASRLTVQVRVATPDYFAAMGIPVIRGRTFDASDARRRPAVALVNETAARLIWPGQDAIGHTYLVGTRLGLGGERVGGQIVGVVGDVSDEGAAARVAPALYVAHAQFPVDSFSVVVKARRDPSGLVEPLRAATAAIDPDLPVFRVKSMAEIEADAVAQPRLFLGLLGLFAAVAIGLAAIGIYGVIAQGVRSRTREIGIRIALGADRRRLARMIVADAVRLSLFGIATGWAIAVAARHLVGRLLFGVAPTDTATYAAVAGLTFTVALLAAWIPARRAAGVDPVHALRGD